jgi:hypothetical protein
MVMVLYRVYVFVLELGGLANGWFDMMMMVKERTTDVPYTN